MGDYTSIMAVTTALAKQLERAIGGHVPGTQITTERPGADDPQDRPRINLFLFHIEPNTSLINNDLPTRSGDGQMLQKPQIGLNLDYLITFYGNETLASLQPQQLAALVIDHLHAHPYLSVADLRNALSGQDNLHADPDPSDHAVFLTQQSIALDSLSRLWSVTFQAPYALSLAYRAAAILLTAPVTPDPAPPVQDRGIHVQAIRWPLIEAVLSTTPARPITYGDTLDIVGRHLTGKTTQVFVGDAEWNLSSDAGTPDRLRVRLDRPALAPGALAVRVLTDQVNMSVPSAIVLIPTLLTVAASRDQAGKPALVATIQPPPGPNAQIEFKLFEADGNSAPPPLAYRLKGAVDASKPPQNPSEATVLAPYTRLRKGTYLVSVSVNNAESELTLDPGTGAPNGPTVTIGAAP